MDDKSSQTSQDNPSSHSRHSDNASDFDEEMKRSVVESEFDRESANHDQHSPQTVIIDHRSSTISNSTKIDTKPRRRNYRPRDRSFSAESLKSIHANDTEVEELVCDHDSNVLPCLSFLFIEWWITVRFTTIISKNVGMTKLKCC